MGIILIIISIPIYFIFEELAIVFSVVGVLALIIKKQKDFSQKIKKERAEKIYYEIRYNFPISEKTISLSKIFDMSTGLNSHKTWLSSALDAFEKEYRISNNKMFLYNRNRTAARAPYISISLENMNYKKVENFPAFVVIDNKGNNFFKKL